MTDKIRIEILSPVEFNDVLAEMYLDGCYLGRVSQERGEANRVVDFIDSAVKEVTLSGLRDCIDLACSRLDEMGRGPL
jgi:hypothetical protein